MKKKLAKKINKKGAFFARYLSSCNYFYPLSERKRNIDKNIGERINKN